MKFEYFGGEQRTPEWYKIRIGKVTASRLGDWLAVSKAKGKEGTPLKKRFDYEKELLFERTFNTTFEKFVSQPMLDGVNFEDFARTQYEKICKVVVKPCGAWYNEFFCASPDGAIEGGKDNLGLLEIKILKDTKFTEVLTEGVPDEHEKQIQGQLWASGRDWCDYVAVNLHTQKLKIIRVLPDKDFHKHLEMSIQEKLSEHESFDTKGVYDFVDVLSAEEVAKLEQGGSEWNF